MKISFCWLGFTGCKGEGGGGLTIHAFFDASHCFVCFSTIPMITMNLFVVDLCVRD